MRSRRFIAFMLAAVLLGGHWAALQSIAWAGMLVARLQVMSVKKAIETTFDGDHPCSMCKAIKKAKSSEQEQQKQDATPSDPVRLPQAILASSPHLLQPMWTRNMRSMEDSDVLTIDLEPTVPPPRSAA